MGFKNGNNINIKLQGSQSFCGTVQHITLRMLKLTLAKKQINSHTYALEEPECSTLTTEEIRRMEMAEVRSLVARDKEKSQT